MSELNEQQEQQEETQTELPEEGAALETPEVVETPEAKEEQPQEDVETLKKRLADTQRWAHQLNEEKRQRQQQEEANRLKTLQDGLDPEAVNFVDRAIELREMKTRQDLERKNREASEAVYEAVPNFDALVGNPLFDAELAKQAQALVAAGKDPMKPTLAVAAVLEAKRQFDMSQARADAEAAEKTRKTSKMAAMNVPGSGAAAHAKAKSPEEEAAAVWNMSAEDFAKAKAKARGF